ncbi:hypothetical protein EDB87DRAFT_1686784 [Lactarius vividus]|nr:hypothetical protein EDB87DRAFT_1686784 [Lactarius vividus]
MAPLSWKASWRRAKNIVIPSDYSGVDVGSGSERHDSSQGEHANPSSDDIVSSTTLTTSTTRRASDDVYTSTPISRLPPTNTPPPSTTNTRFLSTIPSDTPSFPSPRLHLLSEPAMTTSSPEPTTRVATRFVSVVEASSGTLSELLGRSSSSSSSNLRPTQKTEPSVHLDAVLPSPSNPEDIAPTLSSSPFSSKIPATDIPRPTTTPLSGSLRPTKCHLDANGMALPKETNTPSATRTLGYLPLSTSACSLLTQDYNTKAHNGVLLNAPSPQPSLTLDGPLGIPGVSSISNTITTMSSSSSSPLSSTLTRPPGQTLTSAPPLTNGEKGSTDKPVRTTTPFSGGLLVSIPPASKTTPVTTTLLSATSVISSSVLKINTTDSIVVTDHPAGAVYSLIPSGTPQSKGKLKPEPSRLGSSVSLPFDSTSFPGEVGRISIASSPSASLITSTTTTSIPSLTSVDGVRSTPFANPNQFAVVDNLPSTTDFSTPTAFSQDITTSFTTTTAVVTFSPIQISGTSTSIPVTQTVQTVLPTVFPGIPATGNKKSVPIAAIVAPVSAAVVLILLLICFVLHRNRQRAHRSQPAFDFSPPAPAPAMRETEPAQRPPFKEVTVLPPIPTMGGWDEVFALTQGADDPFADPVSIPPSVARLSDESPRTPLVLPPAPTLDPFIDPPTLISTPPEDDGPSRLSKGSSYNESRARASISSSHVGCAM